jgi:hypothetical protein
MPHNFTGLDIKHGNFRKGLFVDPFDEPTYLTFALDFKFEHIPANFSDAEVLLSNSPLFDSTGSQSAINYLINRGYHPQADGLATFREILRYLTFQAPWYFQSITGLTSLYEQNTDMKLGMKAKGVVLEVDTLEAVDLRMFELAGLYRNAILDLKHRRERVPDNLRWFAVDVYVAEFRNLRYRIPGVGQGAANAIGVNTGAIGNIIGGGNMISNVMEQFGYVKFECRQCEFDFSDTLPTTKTIKVGGNGRESESNGFRINVGWVSEEAKFGDGTKVYDDSSKTDIKNPWGAKNTGAAVQDIGTFLSGLPTIGDSIQNAGQKAMAGLSQIGGLINPALQAASNFIDPPVDKLGEMYSKDKRKYKAEPNEDVYDGDVTYGKEPTGDVYDTPITFPDEPTGNVYP